MLIGLIWSGKVIVFILRETLSAHCPSEKNTWMDHLCPEMQAVTKMADLTKFRQLTWQFLCKLHQQRWAWRVGKFDDFGNFYTNYVLVNLTITRDGSNVLANLTILAIFITSWVEAKEKDIYFLHSLSVLPKQNTSSIMRVARKGNGKQYWAGLFKAWLR